MGRIAAAAALLLIGLAPAFADVRITASTGGDVLAYLRFFELLEQSGERIVLDGPTAVPR
jgi:hypothetical protein